MYARIPSIGETLDCECEVANHHDPYVVVLKKSADIVGHVPRSILCIYTLFLRCDGNIKSTVTGHRRHSDDLFQGDLELPCEYKFIGSSNLTQKVHNYLLKKETMLMNCKVRKAVKADIKSLLFLLLWAARKLKMRL